MPVILFGVGPQQRLDTEVPSRCALNSGSSIPPSSLPAPVLSPSPASWLGHGSPASGLMNDAERRPANFDPRRQPAPPPAGRWTAAALARRGVSLRWPVAAAALGRSGGLQRTQRRSSVRRGRLPHLTAPATLQLPPPQPPPRPPPGPQPAPLPRPLTLGLTPAGLRVPANRRPLRASPEPYRASRPITCVRPPDCGLTSL